MTCGFSMLLAGCAGYNTTMFTTKSNAGLDIDMKPPTAEITISRKEAVIEPAFEKGQSLPVMASFKPRVTFGGGLRNYFLGVDQTFTGGDAALTMAKLYNSPTVFGDDLTPFNSELPLTAPLKAKNWFDAPATPGTIRPFIFGTDTILGLKVAWSGVGGQMPDTVKAGFNRKEFAWAPVSVSANNIVKMPSFLATIQSGISGGADTNVPSSTAINQQGGVTSIQYFATGEAATRLAMQKDVRDAMLERLDPAYSPIPNSGSTIILRQILAAMESAFRQLRGQDQIATDHYQDLEKLTGIDVPTSFSAVAPPLVAYTFSAAAGGNKDLITANPSLNIGQVSPLTLSTVTAYLAALDNSIAQINMAKTSLKKNPSNLQITDGKNTRDFTPQDGIDLQHQLEVQQTARHQLALQISANKSIQAALGYFNLLSKP